MIQCSKLRKTYTVKKTRTGFLGGVQDFIRPERRTIESVVDISLTLRRGECVGILGANGSGKSTLVKMFCGILKPTAGALSVLEETPYRRRRAFLKRIGAVLGHKSSLWWDLPLKDSFLSQKIIYNISESKYTNNKANVCAALDLENVLDQPVKNLSLGERVKGEIAINLLHDPEILFLDEPTIGLDVWSCFKLRKYLRDWVTKTGSSVLMTSHNMNDIEGCCHRVMLIDSGCIRFEGGINEFKKKFSQEKIIEISFHDEVLNEEKVQSLLADLSQACPGARLIEKGMAKVVIGVGSDFSLHMLSGLRALADIDVDVEFRSADLEEIVRSLYT